MAPWIELPQGKKVRVREPITLVVSESWRAAYTDHLMRSWIHWLDRAPVVGQLEPVTLVAELVVVVHVHDIAPTNLREVVD